MVPVKFLSFLITCKMALIVTTTQPTALLKSICTAIDNKTVETWSYQDINGLRYFTHTPDQWKNKAWFTAVVYPGELQFGIVKPKDQTLSKVVYGVYHGRFNEMLLSHFDNSFVSAKATAKAVTPDVI